jgi:hypothetical protein
MSPPQWTFLIDVASLRRWVRVAESGITIGSDPDCYFCGHSHSGPPCSGSGGIVHGEPYYIEQVMRAKRN